MNLGIYYKITKGDTQLEFHTHPELEIYYFHEGYCNFQVGEKFFKLEPGDLLLIDGINLHKAFVNQKDHSYIRSVMQFDRKWLKDFLEVLQAEELLDLFFLENGVLYRFKDQKVQKKIHQIIVELNEIFQSKEEYYFESQMLMLTTQLLIEISSNPRESFIDSDSGKDEKLLKVQEVINFLTQHYREQMALTDVAEEVNLSKSYLSHLFKEVTGMTVMECLMGYRLTQAKFFLVTHRSMKVTEIALNNGFESSAHFSRFFKKHTGLSPLQFRKNEKEVFGL